MLKVQFSANEALWTEYRPHLMAAFKAAGLRVDLATDHRPAEVDYVVFAPNGPVADFRPYTKTRAVLGLWAGVESIVGNKTLTQPLARMVDPGLTQGMVEWVSGHVLRHHLGMDTHIKHQDGVWRDLIVPPLARDRPVAILGLGALGAACGQALARLGFPVIGWARSPKAIPGIRCLHGSRGFGQALGRAQILVLLLPLTPDTHHIIGDRALAALPKGSVVINPGRGGLIHDAALLKALDKGRVGHATLDVFQTEPLPPHHPYWDHPKVTVTPHIASATRPDTASQTIAGNIQRVEAGLPLLFEVNRHAGY